MMHSADGGSPAVPTEDLPAPGLPTPFADVAEPLREALEQRGFERLTDVQEAVLAADVEARDLRISSQTGSGKTVAIGFVIAKRLIEAAAEDAKPRTGPKVLVIVPTRELADQVRNELEWLFANVRGVTIECVTGGTSVPQERRRLSRRPRIVVGTPGRLLDHVRTGALDCSEVTQLVLDEADQMLDMGFREDLDAILATLPAERRTHMVSATFPPAVRNFVDAYQSDALHVEGTRLGNANADIEHVACMVKPRDRYGALVNLLLMAGGERTLVFVRTRQDTASVAEQLANDGFAALPLSGDLAQAQRTRTLNAFRNGMVSTLVATDVAARGLDVPDVPMVVQFDPPIDSSVYTHRSGRTGRAGQKGRTVILIPPAAQRRIGRMLDNAGVEVSWRDAPDPDVVKRMLDTRARALMAASLDSEESLSESELEAARSALEGRDAIAVVARLLAMARTSPPCEPMAIDVPMARSAPRAARGPREDHRQPSRPLAYTRFSINWGSRDGATPKRLLAHVCRRGGIVGRQIGSIEVSGSSSTFEVDSGVVEPFAARVRRRDTRDPHLMIRVDGSGGSERRRGRHFG